MRRRNKPQPWNNKAPLKALAAVLLVGALVVVFLPALHALSQVWSSLDYYSHGFLVPIISLLIALQLGRSLGAPAAHGAGLGILGAALVLTVGACMSIPYDSPKVTPIGSFLALWSTAMSGLRPVLTALLLKNSKESGLTPVPLLWYDAGFSTIFLFLAFLVSEETVTVGSFFKEDTLAGMLILISGSTCAFAYNIVVFYLVKVTSSLTSVVLANVKTTLIIVIAVLLWDKSISPISIVGFVIFFAGLFGYSYLTYKSRNRGTTKPAEPVAATGAKETTKLVSS